MNFCTRICSIFICLLFVFAILKMSHFISITSEIRHLFNTISKKQASKHYYEKEEFLIKTPHCSIPNYIKYLTFPSKTHNITESCGERAVFIKKVGNDKILFEIDKKKLKNYAKKKQKISCCYSFGITDINSDSFTYTRCIPFQHRNKVKLLHEVVTVTCSTKIKKDTDIVYKDSYILVHKITDRIKSATSQSWNILVLGMSTMSRGRIYDAMPRTVQYLQTNKWLDYRGYHTVSDEMLPNIISLLTGKKITASDQSSNITLQIRNENITMWHKLRNSGYITAFGHDYFQLPDGFTETIIEPYFTDHQVWPYFHVKYKKRIGNLFCSGYSPSGQQLLNYGSQFIETYKTNKFLGMFWINTFSTRIGTTPTLIDADVVTFFQNINKTGLLNNTFIFLLSDHGMNFGDFLNHQESYYEKRLPMFFMWVPYEFQRLYAKEFNNTKINQHRMLSPHDVHATIVDIITFPNGTNAGSEACPQCTSLFQKIPLHRKCADAGVDDTWCACHFLEDIGDNIRVSKSVKLVVKYIQNKSKTVKTIPYMRCEELHFKFVLRTHTFIENNKIYYLIAVQMSPGNFSYESKVLDDKNELSIVLPVMSISRHGRGYCALDPNDRKFCFCNITTPT